MPTLVTVQLMSSKGTLISGVETIKTTHASVHRWENVTLSHQIDGAWIHLKAGGFSYGFQPGTVRGYDEQSYGLLFHHALGSHYSISLHVTFW